MAADLRVLHEGYAGLAGVAATVILVRDEEQTIVVDPGMVADQQLILGPLRDAGLRPEDVTDVVISHHHPDHTWHVGLLPAARLHDVWAVYRGDQRDSHAAEGRQVSPHVALIERPGHTAGHQHPGHHGGAPGRLHPSVVARGRAGRGPSRHRPAPPARQPGAGFSRSILSGSCPVTGRPSFPATRRHADPSRGRKPAAGVIAR